MSLDEYLHFGLFRLDPANQRLWQGTQPVALRPKAYALLRYLVEDPNRVIPQQKLVLALWRHTHLSGGLLRGYIRELRRALGDEAKAPQLIRAACRSARRAPGAIRRPSNGPSAGPCSAARGHQREGAMRHADGSRMTRTADVHGVTTRRSVIALGAAAVAGGRAWPGDKPRRIGFLAIRPRPKPGAVPIFDAFFAGMRELRYEEGRDYVMEWKVTAGIAERYPGAAAELVASGVDLLLCGHTTAAAAAKNATSTIPIVMTGLNDPVTSGLVPSLARPGGNITGLSALDDELHSKRLGLLRDLLPAIASVAVLWNAEDSTHRHEVVQLQALARRLALDIRPVELSRVEDVAAVFEQLERLRPGAVFVPATAWHVYDGAAVFAAATRARLPTIGSERFHATGGALLTYGADFTDLWRRAAGYVDKIFKGAKPADLPIQQPTKFELLINLKTANALGVTIPKDLLLRADHLIR